MIQFDEYFKDGLETPTRNYLLDDGMNFGDGKYVKNGHIGHGPTKHGMPLYLIRTFLEHCIYFFWQSWLAVENPWEGRVFW